MNLNKHIEDYLNYYCEMDSPEYAVLVKGLWGSGKTWFIRQYCEIIESKEQKVLYVSLYGMSSYSQIEDAFFQQLHPFLSNKAVKFVGKLLVDSLKAATKIDLNGDGKEEILINSQVPELKLPLKNIENCVLVFDDLERSKFDIKIILGYINHFVEHQGMKVIIIANENEIGDTADYLNIKEKLVGQTFEIVTDCKAAIKKFIESVSNKDAKKFLNKSTNSIEEIYELSKYKNLRHLKQAIRDFERLYLSLPEESRSNDELVLRLLRLLLAFSFEIRQGKLEAKNIESLNEVYWEKFATDKKGETKIGEFIEKYAILNFPDLLLSAECWVDFLEKGIVNKEIIEKSVNESVYYQDESTPEWKKLWYFREATNEEFRKALKEVNEKYKNKDYEDIGIIKHVVGLFLWMSDNHLIKKSKASIIADAKKYIQHLKVKGLLPKEEISSYHNDSYEQLQFFGHEMKEFDEVLDYINKEIVKTNTENMPKAGTDLLRIMAEDTDKYSRMIRICNSPDQIYYNVPIFNFVKPVNFISAFMKLRPVEKRLVIVTFNERYQFGEKELLGEAEWLKNIVVILNKKIEKIKGVEAHMISSFYIPSLEKNIEKLEKIKNEEVVASVS